ncbi:hypothetical protein O5559_27355, partial [Escherichia coli]|nr:hypothetical protein [Escherichia coli]
ITEILGFNLPVDMIATSHGVVWRYNPTPLQQGVKFLVGRFLAVKRRISNVAARRSFHRPHQPLAAQKLVYLSATRLSECHITVITRNSS